LASIPGVHKGGAEYSFGYSDVQLLADELSAYGDEVSVLSPPELKAAVNARFLAVLTAHDERIS
jgi:predicted DNA-binding transcriptional regulator YafY